MSTSWQTQFPDTHLSRIFLILIALLLSIDRLLFGLVSEFLRERSPAMIIRQLPLAARLTLRVGTRAGPTLSTSDDGRKETDYQS